MGERKIDVKAAVASAQQYVKELYAGQSLRDLLLEEVEYVEHENEWRVTIGFSLPKEEQSMVFTPRQLSRHYKEVRVNAETGESISMRIRTV